MNITTKNSPPKKRPTFLTAADCQAGATLLEMMISLFVMGIGLMGIVALQTQSVRFNHQAYSFSQAVFLSQDILESMRANQSVANTYQVAKADALSNVRDCSSNNCTPQQMRNWDIAQWKDNIAKRLPGGKASIDLAGDTYTINIEFDLVKSEVENPTNNTPEKQQYILKTGL